MNAEPYVLETPVLFLVFNRPETTRRVFAQIRRARPPRLYVASDGPRADRDGESAVVQSVRETVLAGVDWPCEVKTLFRDRNLGCKLAVSEAISWFFDQETMGVILEDDCLPSLSFFSYCETLLNVYKDDNRIFIINGYNYRQSWHPEQYDYFFSNFGGCWGWASWRRAWNHYDPEMKDLALFAAQGCFEDLLGRKVGHARKIVLQQTCRNHGDSWAYPWGFARHKNNGLACVPAKSLIANIGFGANATHTRRNRGGNIEAQEISFPLQHNSFMVPDRAYDARFHPTPTCLRRWLRYTLDRIGNPVKRC